MGERLWFHECSECGHAITCKPASRLEATQDALAAAEAERDAQKQRADEMERLNRRNVAAHRQALRETREKLDDHIAYLDTTKHGQSGCGICLVIENRVRSIRAALSEPAPEGEDA